MPRHEPERTCIVTREANSPGLRALGWTIGLTLVAAGICFGVAAILHATA